MDDAAFEKRLKEEYSKWVDLTQGKGPKVEVPFLPICSFERSLFTEFVAELISRAISPDFNMLSVVTRDGKPAYMLVERVEKGRFVSLKLVPAIGIEEAKKEYSINITKAVERSVLEEAFALQDKYKKARDRRAYALELAAMLISALKTAKLSFSPEPKALSSFLLCTRDIRLDAKGLLNFKDYLASVEMCSGRRSVFLDLGTPMRIVVEKGQLFSLIPKIESSSSLAELLDNSLTWMAEGFKTNAVRVEPGSFIWRGLENLVEHDARRVGEKMKFMLSMLADPLFLLVMVGKEAYLLEFKKGVIAGIEEAESKGDLKSTWLELSMKRGFVHLGFRVDQKVLEGAKSPLHLPSVLKKGVYEFYPKNEFIEHLNNMGALNLVLRLVYPFVKK